MSLRPPEAETCSFCEYLRGERPCAFVARETAASAFVNPTQYGHGALLVIPNQHVVTQLDAGADDVRAVASLVRRVARALDAAFDITGLNVFQNNGLASGQHIPHFHVHVVPRYGDAEPMKLFRQKDFRFQPVEELEPIASQIREFLEAEEG